MSVAYLRNARWPWVVDAEILDAQKILAVGDAGGKVEGVSDYGAIRS